MGFELTSGAETVNEKSEIDLIIQYSTKITPELSKILLNLLDKMPIKTDIQIEMKDSSFV